jgi:DDE superfamily endonuclease
METINDFSYPGDFVPDDSESCIHSTPEENFFHPTTFAERFVRSIKEEYPILPRGSYEKTSVPPIFFDWVNYLCSVLNVRSIPTFIELLIGSMITQTGFVTDAQMAIVTKRHWSSYYKWIQQGMWSYLSLARQMLRLVVKAFSIKQLFIIFDDTNVPRSSKKAPDVKYHHQHGNKPNRPQYIWGQCWLTMGVALGNGCAIPIVLRLISTTSNTGKLIAAKVILRAMNPVLADVSTTMLVDSWFMRKTLLLPALEEGFEVIGQVRIDTALYAIPEPPKQKGRGRPKIYGEKQTHDHFMALPAKRAKMHLYNKEQVVHYRSLVAKARFLKGRIVKTVFCQSSLD